MLTNRSSFYCGVWLLLGCACSSGSGNEVGETAEETADETAEIDAGTEVGGGCELPLGAITPTWSADLEALPEVEGDTILDNDVGSISLELACVITSVMHEGEAIHYALDCEHPDAGTVALALSLEASAPPADVSAGNDVTFLIDASTNVGGERGGPQALIAAYQRLVLLADSGPLAVIEAGLGADIYTWNELTLSLEHDCAELDAADDAAGYYLAELGSEAGNRVEVGVGEVGSFSGTLAGAEVEYEIEVFQASIHGCCHGNEGSFALARIGG